MLRCRTLSVAGGAAAIVAVIVVLAANGPSLAQPGGGTLKLAGNAAQSFSGFEALLAKHGDKTMMLTVEVLVAGPKIDKEEVIGKLSEATDAFLVVKLQNQRDLVFIPWQRVLSVTARPSA
jgi:hypothetical protein